MGILKNTHGVYYARKKVPRGLEEAVARAIGAPRPRVSWLKKSLRTQDAREANLVAKRVLIEFDRILEQAAKRLEATPLRTELTEKEIAALSDYYFASLLEEDEEFRLDDKGDEELFQKVGRQLTEAGVRAVSSFPSTPKPAFGLSERQLYKSQESVAWALPAAREALARGDLSFVQFELDDFLDGCDINLDKACVSYRRLGYLFLKRQVDCLEAVDRRNRGEVVETPPLIDPIQKESQCTGGGGTLSVAMEGWKKARQPGLNVVSDYAHAVRRFTELHGDLEIISIRRSHVREFREALQAMPVRKAGALKTAALPQLVEWAKNNPGEPKIASATVNKLLGGVQAIAVWGHNNGVTPDDATWSDPFAKMRLEENEPDREPWELAELRLLFNSPVFASGDRPEGGCGEAAYWLPLLGLFTGARQGELAPLRASDVTTDEATGVTFITVAEDEERGTRLKTASSRRAVPVHPELLRLGFLKVVDEARKLRGDSGSLFPQLKPGPRGGYAEAWSKWFGRYIRAIGIENKSRVFHSFRHGFKDALQAAGEAEDINDALTGHSGGGVGRSYGAREMIRRFGLSRLSEAVSKVSYPGLDLSHLQPSTK